MKIIYMSVVVFALTSVGNSVYHNRNARRGHRRRVHYEHFDDYLLTVIGHEQRADNDVIERVFGRDGEETTSATSTVTTTTTEEPSPTRARGHHHHHHAHKHDSTRQQNITVTTDDEDIADSSGDGDDDSTPSTPPTSSTMSGVGLDILGYFRDVPRQHWSCCMLGKLAGDKGFHCHAGFYAARITMRNYNRAHNRRMPLLHGPNRRANWGRGIMYTFRRCVSRHSDDFHKCCYAAAVEKREITRWRRIRQNNMRRNRSSHFVRRAESE